MESNERLCMKCMTYSLNESGVCSNCGTDESKLWTAPHFLKPRTVLNGKYMVGSVIGEGGFGITYVGWDQTLSLKVAIKEYFPSGFVSRDTTASATVHSFVNSKDFYVKGRERFINEAQRLAKFFGLPGIVAVRDFFTENDTAYIVMEFVEGATMKKVLESMGWKMPEAHVLEIMKPLVRSLASMHKAGIIHRDIAPDNIMIQPDGSVKLLDFGAAKEVASDGKSTAAIIKHGFAPEEQYDSNLNRQGPWTDVYAISATVFCAIEGKTPPDALARLRGEDFGGFTVPVSENTRRVVVKGLSLRPEDRWQDVDQLARELYPDLMRVSSSYGPTPEPEPPVPAPEPALKPEPEKKKLLPFIIGGGAGAAVIIIAVLFLTGVFNFVGAVPSVAIDTPAPTPEASEEPTAEPESTPEISEEPTPAPESTPEISEEPTPAPVPEVSEEPTPEPAPGVSEAPTPAPTPEASEAPAPSTPPPATAITPAPSTPAPSVPPADTSEIQLLGFDDPVTWSFNYALSTVYDVTMNAQYATEQEILTMLRGASSSAPIDLVLLPCPAQYSEGTEYLEASGVSLGWINWVLDFTVNDESWVAFTNAGSGRDEELGAMLEAFTQDDSPAIIAFNREHDLLALQETPAPAPQTGAGSTAGNIMNSGYAAETADGRIVYTTDASEMRIMRPDGGNKTTVLSCVASSINVVGDYIYFTDYRNSDWIYKIKTDGTGKTLLYQATASTMQVAGGKIYFVNESSSDNICVINTDGSGYKVLSGESVNNIQIVGGKIYYDVVGLIYSMNTDGAGVKQIPTSVRTTRYQVVGDRIYYRKENKLYYMNLDGSGDTKVSDVLIPLYFNVYNGRVYCCTEEGTFVGMNLDGSDTRVLYNGEVSFINISGGLIFFSDSVDYANYVMSLDGSNLRAAD